MGPGGAESSDPCPEDGTLPRTPVAMSAWRLQPPPWVAVVQALPATFGWSE
jgi:hypothetical protein